MKGDVYTFMGGNSFKTVFLPSTKGSTIKTEFASREKFFPFGVDLF